MQELKLLSALLCYPEPELLEALLERAREDGYTAISLSTGKAQTAFYERFGFVQVAENPHGVTMLAPL